MRRRRPRRGTSSYGGPNPLSPFPGAGKGARSPVWLWSEDLRVRPEGSHHRRAGSPNAIPSVPQARSPLGYLAIVVGPTQRAGRKPGPYGSGGCHRAHGRTPLRRPSSRGGSMTRPNSGVVIRQCRFAGNATRQGRKQVGQETSGSFPFPAPGKGTGVRANALIRPYFGSGVP